MENLLNIEEEFKQFMDAVGLSEMPSDHVQFTEMRKAFIGGLMCMFHNISKINSMSEADAMQALEGVSQTLLNVEI
jgi:hypothetical protein